MTVEELVDDLTHKIRSGRISGEDQVQVRDPDVSEAAMEAGSNGYFEVDEILVPRDGRVILLGTS